VRRAFFKYAPSGGMSEKQYYALVTDYNFFGYSGSDAEWNIKHSWAPHCQWTSGGSYVSPYAPTIEVDFDGFLYALGNVANKRIDDG